MPETSSPKTIEHKPLKRGPSLLNLLLFAVLIGLIAWAGMRLMEQKQITATNVHESEAELALLQERVSTTQDKITAMQERIEALEALVGHQQKLIVGLSAPGKSGVAGEALSNGVISALEARINELDKRVSNITPTTGGPSAAPEMVKSLEARIAQLEAKNMTDEDAKRLATLRAFYLLQSAIFQGKPYSAEYIGFSDLVGEQSDIADAMDVLNSYAEDGIPTQQVLLKQFSEVERQALSVALPENAPFFERLGHNLSSLVTVRKVGEYQKGLDKQAVLARAEAHMQKGELEAAVAEVQSLNVSDQALFAEWLDDAKVRLDIPATLSQIQESLLRNGAPAPTAAVD